MLGRWQRTGAIAGGTTTIGALRPGRSNFSRTLWTASSQTSVTPLPDVGPPCINHHRGWQRNPGLFRRQRIGDGRETLQSLALAVDASGDLFIADTEQRRPRGQRVHPRHHHRRRRRHEWWSRVQRSGHRRGALALPRESPWTPAATCSSPTRDNVVREVNASTHIITTVAGNGGQGYVGDNGPATAAALWNPAGIAVDSSGDLFIADTSNSRIREVNASTQIITTVAGNGTAGYGGDNGPATAAELSYPVGIALDSSGDLFIADGGNSRIREVNASTHLITTVAGGGTPGYNGDNGPATLAELKNPQAIALDASGDLFIADNGNNVIREVNASTQTIITLAGNGTKNYGGDNGPATAAELSISVSQGSAGGLALDASGDLFIADSYNQRIREVTANVAVAVFVAPAPTTTTLAASAASLVYGQTETLTATIASSAGTPIGGIVTFYDGTTALGTAGLTGATAAIPISPLAAGSHQFSATYSSYSANYLGSSSLTVGPASIITTVAGGGTNAGPTYNGPATAAALNLPAGVAVDGSGDLFIADTQNNVIREVNASTHVITTVAGGGPNQGATYSGPATAVVLGGPIGIALDTSGDLFIADTGDDVVREVNASTHVITTLAGNGVYGYVGDNGPAAAAELNHPYAIAVDSSGDLFIADMFNQEIREINASTHVITTVAGNGFTGYLGDNGPATAAELRDPAGVALDGAGDLLIADTGNNVVREVNASTHVITTVAGNGVAGYLGDNVPATAAELANPTGIVVDASGDLFIADVGNARIREVNASTHLISTLAGNGVGGYGGDNGPATAAELSMPAGGPGVRGVALDASGDLFIADTVNARIREVAANVAVEVAPATVSVTISNVSRTYGSADPVFTASYSGFVLGQTLSNSGVSGAPSLTATDSSTSPVGSYLLTAAQGSLSAQNYTFTFAGGTLSVTPATLTVTAEPQVASRTYGSFDPAYADAITGFVLGQTLGDSGVTGAEPLQQRHGRQLGGHLRDHRRPGHPGGAELHVLGRQWHPERHAGPSDRHRQSGQPDLRLFRPGVHRQLQRLRARADVGRQRSHGRPGLEQRRHSRKPGQQLRELPDHRRSGHLAGGPRDPGHRTPPTIGDDRNTAISQLYEHQSLGAPDHAAAMHGNQDWRRRHGPVRGLGDGAGCRRRDPVRAGERRHYGERRTMHAHGMGHEFGRARGGPGLRGLRGQP